MYDPDICCIDSGSDFVNLFFDTLVWLVKRTVNTLVGIKYDCGELLP